MKKKIRWQAMPMALRMMLGGFFGALLGFALYWFIGCKTGACPLTGNPYISMLIWGGMGAILAGKP